MYILQMNVENFRIFYGSHTFSFIDKKLVIIRGLNGHGKSSFFDAIEWCLTGDIQRYVGSAERQKFHYIVHQSLLSQNPSVEPIASVELWINSDSEIIRIKRLFHAEKTIQKPIIINGIAYAVRPGNQKIRELMLHNLVDQVGTDKKELAKVELPVLLSSTQFLSQGQLQAFISAKKPQERYAVLEKVLGIQKYGSEFQQYIKNIKEVVENQRDAVAELIVSKDQQLKIKQSIVDEKENLLKKIGGETEQTLLNKTVVLIGEISESEIGLPQVDLQSLSNATQMVLLELRKLLQERTSASESNYKLIQESETILSFSDKDFQHKLLEISSTIETFNQKQIRYEANKQRYINRRSELNLLKVYRANYQETMLSLNDLREKIKGKTNAKEQLLKDPTLLTVAQLHNSLKEFKQLYTEKSNYYNLLLEYLKVMEKEKKVQSIKIDLEKIKQKIIIQSDLLKQTSTQVSLLKDKKKQIEQKVEDHKNNAAVQMIHSVQSHLLKESDEHSPCPVCGSTFLEPSSLHKAIRYQLEEINKSLDKNEVELRDINTNLSTSEAAEANISKIISTLSQQRDTLMIQIHQEEIASASERAKIPEAIQQLNEEQAKSDAIKDFEFLSLNDSAFKLCVAIDRLDEEINPFAAKEVILSQKLSNLRKIANKRAKLLESTAGVIEHRLQRVDMYLLRLKESVNTISTELIEYNAKRNELENQKQEKEIKLIEICKSIPDFNVEERQTRISQLIYRVNLLKKWDAELENQLIMVEAFLSRSNLMALKTELSILSDELVKERDKSKYYKGLLDQLNQLDEGHGKIQTELMNEYLQRYSEKIDDLFMQISPHAFFKHVHLIPKDGELYIVVSDKNERDLSKLPPEELEKRFNASLTFSAAQSNVLAVCIFLALGLSQEWTPLQTIGIDDPFQNLDDINVFSFLDVLSQVLLDKQVIISTHDDKFANLIRYKSNLENDGIAEIWLESYSKDSISIQSDALIPTSI